MSIKNNIQDELSDLNSELPAYTSQPNFSVPEGYFDGLAAAIINKVKSSEASAAQELTVLSPLLATISREMPYSVPLFYFDQNLANLPGLMDDSSSATLDAIGKKLPFTAPSDFFENLPSQVMARVSTPTAKIIPLFKRGWLRAAAAAVISGVIFISGYQYFSAKNGDSTAQASVRADNHRPEQPLVQEIKKASTKELDEFIEDLQIASTKEVKKSSPFTNSEEVKALLKDVSDNDMDAFLSTIPTADDESSVTD